MPARKNSSGSHYFIECKHGTRFGECQCPAEVKHVRVINCPGQPLCALATHKQRVR